MQRIALRKIIYSKLPHVYLYRAEDGPYTFCLLHTATAFRNPLRLFQKKRQFLEKIISEHLADNVIFVGPEYLVTNKIGSVSQKTHDSHVEKMKELSSGHDCLLIPATILHGNPVKNTSYAYSNGKIITAYRKRLPSDLEIYLRTKHNVAFDFGSQPGGFSWKNQKCSIQICADTFFSGHLTKEAHLRIYQAAGGHGDRFRDMLIAPGGYSIEVDSKKGCKVYKK